MKSSLKPLFVLIALAVAMGTFSLGCSKKDEEAKPGAPAGNSAPDAAGNAGAPPKTHD